MGSNRTFPRVAAAVALLAPALGAAQTATVDQVLAAIAEVVRDRAKAVASRTVAAQLTKNLCEGTVGLPLDGPEPRSRAAPGSGAMLFAGTEVPEAPAPASEARTLYLGGKPECRSAYLSPEKPKKRDAKPDAGGAAAPPAKAPATIVSGCDADDVFVRTCRVAKRLEVPLTDAYFLKTLSRDVVEFLMRVGGRGLTALQYARSGLPEVGSFIHAILEQLGKRKPSPRELADPPLALADLLSSGLQPEVLRKLLDTKAPAKLEDLLKQKVVAPWVSAGCAPYDPNGERAKKEKTGPCKLGWYEGKACEDHSKLSAQRDVVFDSVFGTRSAPGPLYRGRDAVCGEAFASEGEGKLAEQCRQARLTINLYGSLVRARCAKDASPDRIRPRLRELVYVVAEQRVYREALASLEVATGPLDAFLDAFQALDVSELPREELAAGFRVVGTYAAAADLAPEGTRRWLAMLERDLERLAPERNAYASLLHGEALGTDTHLDSPPVVALRDAAKDLLVLPALAVVRYQRDIDEEEDARRTLEGLVRAAIASMEHLLVAVKRDPASSGAFDEYVGALSAFVSDLGRLTAAIGEALDGAAPAGTSEANLVKPAARKPGDPPRPSLQDRQRVFRQAALAMASGALALQLAAERDWVGLALQLGDEVTRLPGVEGNLSELERSLRFVRILMAMYQAPTVDEAKAIFASNLDDLASRERRYPGPRWTVDVAALVGVTGGKLHVREIAETGETVRDTAALYGIYAPVGVQFASGVIGFLAYPVDVGSYLTSSDSKAESGPDWRSAFRAGGALYLRFWADIPVVFGAGYDYRFKLAGRDEWRLFGTASLELPLFTLH
jgi:hypothetical protein